MSKSFKNIPMTRDTGKYTYRDKRNANRSVRNTENIQDGSSFKKCFNSYDISDYKYGSYTWEEAWEEINKSEEDMQHFYEYVLPKPYLKKPLNEKELKRKFYKMISK